MTKNRHGSEPSLTSISRWENEGGALKNSPKRSSDPTGPLPAINLRLTPEELARLDDWISRQKDSPSRAEAALRLINQALELHDIANRTKRR